jgi:hypothetical protein
VLVLLSVLELAESARIRADQSQGSLVADGAGPFGRIWHTYDIFEGTEQIQQLVISRAITGMRIE